LSSDSSFSFLFSDSSSAINFLKYAGSFMFLLSRKERPEDKRGY
jgi:hypothetical protein